MEQLTIFGGGATTCRRCGRVLTDPASVDAGIGPVCVAKQEREMQQRHEGFDQYSHCVCDLPWDPGTRDIQVRRGPDDRLHFNIGQAHTWHSPGGFEWGYHGSGPADFALNILALFIPPSSDPEENQRLSDKTSVHGDVTRLHQAFKAQYVATLPREGGTILGATIRGWIASMTYEEQEA